MVAVENGCTLTKGCVSRGGGTREEKYTRLDGDEAVERNVIGGRLNAVAGRHMTDACVGEEGVEDGGDGGCGRCLVAATNGLEMSTREPKEEAGLTGCICFCCFIPNACITASHI